MIISHSHRVRIATHPDFKDMVLETNKRLKGKKGKGGLDLEGRLEYFDVGGDPKELMAYMVKSMSSSPSRASYRRTRLDSEISQSLFHSLRYSTLLSSCF